MPQPGVPQTGVPQPGVPQTGVPLPAGLHLPPYGTGTLAEVLPGAAAVLGAPVHRGDAPADPLGLATALTGVRRIAVLLVDGLGADLLAAHPDDAPVLSALATPAGVLSAPCPSTTPVSLTTLGTGLPPGSHGVLGFVTEVPGRDRVLNHVQWRDDPDPAEWQARPTVFEHAAAAGVACTVLAPHAFERSGLTRAAYRGARFRSAVGPGDLVAGLHQALAAGERALAYGYLSELDTTGHVRGVDSPAWRHQLALVDRLVEQLVAGLPADAALLVTADHGMVDVPTATRLDTEADPRLTAGVRRLTGEPRARYVHTEPGAAADVLAAWTEVLGDRAWVSGREEAVASGVFGPVGPGLVGRIGDVVVFARGSWAFTAPATEPGPARLAAFHGSLTRPELAVPLLAARAG